MMKIMTTMNFSDEFSTKGDGTDEINNSPNTYSSKGPNLKHGFNDKAPYFNHQAIVQSL